MSPVRSRLVVGLTTFVLACGADRPADDDGGQSEGGTQGGGSTQGETGGDTQGVPLRPNWHEDIAPLVHGSCVGCHFDGGIGPFALDTYERAAPLAELLDDAVASEQMPPWGALETDECRPAHRWRHDTRLSPEQKQLFADWAAHGAPEGDPADAAPLPAPVSLELPDPSAVLPSPSAFTVGGDKDSFVCMAIDPALDKDVWITGVQMVPDNVQVVHHVLMYVDRDAVSDGLIDDRGAFPCPGGFVGFDGSMQIGTWVPGAVPVETPAGVGLPMPAGSRIILAFHYHPTGAGDEVDQSSIALRWTDQKPAVNGLMGLFGNNNNLEPGPNDPDGAPVFMIPPNVSGHVEGNSIVIPDLVPPTPIFTLGTHMHYVGVDMKVWIERDGQEICLLQTPRWDFNWQRNYDVDAPLDQMPTIQGGDRVRIRCTYDNTMNNPALVQVLAEQGLSEPKTVYLGEESLDEMCLFLFGLATNLPLDQF